MICGPVNSPIASTATALSIEVPTDTGDGVPRFLKVPRETTATLARIRTRLDPFSDAEQCSLINWGYAVCDAAMRKYVVPGATQPASWPYPDYRLDQPLQFEVEPGTGDLPDPPEAP